MRYNGLRKKGRQSPLYQTRPQFRVGHSSLRGLLPREIEVFYDRIESIRIQREGIELTPREQAEFKLYWAE